MRLFNDTSTISKKAMFSKQKSSQLLERIFAIELNYNGENRLSITTETAACWALLHRTSFVHCKISTFEIFTVKH